MNHPHRDRTICLRISHEELSQLEVRVASETHRISISEFVRRVLFPVPARAGEGSPPPLPAPRVSSKKKSPNKRGR